MLVVSSIEKENAKKPASIQTVNVVVKPKLTYNEQKELENLETQIENLENTISAKTKELNQCADNTTIMALAADIDTLKNTLDVKTNRWLELSDKAKG